ncbi:MAG TPA: hypothetical protein DEA55_00825 [Rhodospirillaceae bacterium]|nr:hypothetical protein [Rhodospirillaceae bacterium]
MALAIAMNTIRVFERALGGRVFCRATWQENETKYEPVERLRIHPHALRQAKAYYSISKVALPFGYFRNSAANSGANLPGGWMFTALSRDIVVRETTHTIVDGLHRRLDRRLVEPGVGRRHQWRGWINNAAMGAVPV